MKIIWIFVLTLTIECCQQEQKMNLQSCTELYLRQTTPEEVTISNSNLAASFLTTLFQIVKYSTVSTSSMVESSEIVISFIKGLRRMIKVMIEVRNLPLLHSLTDRQIWYIRCYQFWLLIFTLFTPSWKGEGWVEIKRNQIDDRYNSCRNMRSADIFISWYLPKFCNKTKQRVGIREIN